MAATSNPNLHPALILMNQQPATHAELRWVISIQNLGYQGRVSLSQFQVEGHPVQISILNEFEAHGNTWTTILIESTHGGSIPLGTLQSYWPMQSPKGGPYNCFYRVQSSMELEFLTAYQPQPLFPPIPDSTTEISNIEESQFKAFVGNLSDDYEFEYRTLSKLCQPSRLELGNDAIKLESLMGEGLFNLIHCLTDCAVGEFLVEVAKYKTVVFSSKDGLVWSDVLAVWQRTNPVQYLRMIVRLFGQLLMTVVADIMEEITELVKGCKMNVPDMEIFHTNATRAIKQIRSRGFLKNIADEMMDAMKKHDSEIPRILVMFEEFSWWLPLRGCKTIHLRTFEVRNRTTQDLVFDTINFNFTYDSSKSDYENFNTAAEFIFAMAGQSEEARTRLLLLAFLPFIKYNIERTFPIIFGSGLNGKTLFFSKILSAIMGNLCTPLHESLICVTKGGEAAHSKFLGSLVGMYHAVFNEPKSKVILDNGLVKKIGDVGGDSEVIRNAYEEGPGYKRSINVTTTVIANGGTISFAGPIDDATKERITLHKCTTKFLPEEEYNALDQEEKESGAYAIKLNESELLTPAFLQGMFNYIIFEGGHRYWQAKSTSSTKIFKFDQELFNEVIRVTSTEFGGWFKSVTNESTPTSQVFMDDLCKLYSEQERQLWDELRMMNTIKLILPDGEFGRGHYGTRNRRYLLGYQLIDAAAIQELGSWFHNTYTSTSDQDDYVVVDEVRRQRDDYLKAKPENPKNFKERLVNAMEGLVATNKDRIIKGKREKRWRFHGWRARTPDDLPYMLPLAGSSTDDPVDVAIRASCDRSLFST